MFTIDLDTLDIDRSLNRLITDQVPFATMLTLNEVGGEVLEAVEGEIEKSFDNPTRWTKRAFYLQRATKKKLSATVQRKTAVGRRFYLEVQAEGGTRRMTGTERLIKERLRYAGDIQTVAPASGLRLNRYGNVSPAQLQRILSGLKVQRDSAQNTSATSKKRAKSRATYFTPARGGLSPGVYERKPGKRKIKKVLNFSSKKARYEKRLDIVAPAKRVSRERLRPVFDRALVRAIKTAR